MAIKKGFFRELFSSKKYSITHTEKGIHINLNFEPLGEQLDLAQLMLDQRVWNDMQQYMPTGQGSGHLVRMTNELNAISAGTGEVHVYDPLVEYAHYQYEGEKYVDPVYRVGGFFSPDWGWWSRPGVTKVPSGEPLFYHNPKAESHWDEATIRNHEQEWVKLVKEILE